MDTPRAVTTSSGEVIFDKTAINHNHSYASNNSNLATMAKVDDVITVSIVGSELLRHQSTVASNPVTDETAGGTNAIWTGTYNAEY